MFNAQMNIYVHIYEFKTQTSVLMKVKVFTQYDGRTFCGQGRFVDMDVLQAGRFVGEDVLEAGRFVAGHFVAGGFVEGRFVGVPEMYLISFKKATYCHFLCYQIFVHNYRECSQRNMMNASRYIYSVVINQPKKDNNRKHQVFKILEE